MAENSTGNFDIETQRLTLLCCHPEVLEAIFKGDEALAELLSISIPVKWTRFGEPFFRQSYQEIRSGVLAVQWSYYLPILRKTRTLLGCCGYLGNPSEGVVEIAFEVAEAYRGFGLATEMAKSLIAHAFESNEVKLVRAHTPAIITESGSVLKKCGMTQIAEVPDRGDGRLWRWEIKKESDT